MQADLAGLQLDLLSLAGDRALFQIDSAAFTEGGHHRAGLRVQRDKAVAGGDVENPVVTLAVGPVRHASSRKLARRDGGAITLAVAVRPDQLAGAAVERDNRTPGAGGRVEDALDGQRSA